MYLDFALAALHHILVFSLFGAFLVEMTSVRPGLSGAAINRLARIDALYGALSLGVIAVGVLRVIYGLKGWEYYATNHSFWGKMTAFLLVGILSLPPSIRIGRWRKAQKADAAFAVPEGEARSLRRFLHAEALLFIPIVIFAAAMARGIG
jgi:putative membrane protein